MSGHGVHFKIAAEYSEATVYIEVSWSLIDTKTGEQLYHWYDEKGKPVYIRLRDKTVEPFLVNLSLLTSLKANGMASVKSLAIGGSHTGSGFVVTSNGFILTNRHVAAAWRTAKTVELELPGLLLNVDENNEYPRDKKGNLIFNKIESFEDGGLKNWVPARSKQQLQDEFHAIASGKQPKMSRLLSALEQSEGRLNRLNVAFPGQKQRVKAELVRISDSADVAMIRIQMPYSLKNVQFKEDDVTLAKGDPITILGYPGISPLDVLKVESQDIFSRMPSIVSIPDPTVTTGNVSIVYGEKSELRDSSKLADYYNRPVP